MKTALQILKDKLTSKMISCEKRLQEIEQDKMPSIYLTTDAMRMAYKIAIDEIEQLIPTEQENFANFSEIVAKTCEVKKCGSDDDYQKVIWDLLEQTYNE